MILYIGLGSNLGDKSSNVEQAIKQIKEQIGPVVSVSALFASDPWGFKSDNAFVNSVIGVVTDLDEEEILSRTQAIEQRMGKTARIDRSAPYTDRIIDIDLLIADGGHTFHSPSLILPHPLMTERSFVMVPLSEIAPDLLHPTKQKSIRQLTTELVTPSEDSCH